MQTVDFAIGNSCGAAETRTFPDTDDNHFRIYPFDLFSSSVDESDHYRVGSRSLFSDSDDTVHPPSDCSDAETVLIPKIRMESHRRYRKIRSRSPKKQSSSTAKCAQVKMQSKPEIKCEDECKIQPKCELGDIRAESVLKHEIKKEESPTPIRSGR